MSYRGMKCAAAAAICVVLSLAFAASASAQCGPMDVVFIIDSTGSMSGVLENVKSQLPSIIDQVDKASGGNYQLGLLTFHDDVTVIVDLGAKNVDAVKNGINGLTAGGGSDEPEASDEAVRTAVDNLKASARPGGKQTGDFSGRWRTDAAKIVILVTDARPGGFDDTYTSGTDDVDVVNISKDALAKDIHISAVFVPTDPADSFGVADTVAAIMQSYATNSDGIYLKTKSDGSGTSDAIKDIVARCGGKRTSGVSNLDIQPDELVLTNGQTGIVRIINYAASTDANNPTTYSVDPAEPGEFTTEFHPVTTAPGVEGTQEIDLQITVGPSTFQGTHLMAVRATTGDFHDLAVVHVIVDCRPPFFLGKGQPQDATVNSGSKATITASPSGDGPFRFQWYRGHTGITTFPISGATSATLTTDPVTDRAEYWVQVKNACGARNSETAVVNPK